MPNPFPGLRPFKAEEAALFAGRETIADSLTARIRVAPLTLMFARSGVGKSSFLNCRLMPHLHTESPIAYLNEWGSDRPERLVVQKLGELLQQPAPDERPVLVLDQFEDVFKSPGSRNKLWDSLAEITNIAEGPAHVLVSMREEWLGAWHESEDFLPDALSCLLRLRPLSAPELVDAVVKPALREKSVVFDPGLAAQLVTDLKRPSPFGLEGLVVEPGLLQLVCRRLWSVASDRGLTKVDLALYEELGGADLIVREFVWNELGSAGLDRKEIPEADRPKPRFSAADRVMWSGLTRHVIAAQGVKAIVSADRIAHRLLVQDMGVTGLAVAEDVLPPPVLHYLEASPEKRGAVPAELLGWIEGVFEAAVDVGFMKRQQQLAVDEVAPETADGGPPVAATRYMYELSHDALADIFQVFKIEFEGWILRKLAKILGVIIALVIVLPFVIYLIATAGIQSLGTLLLVILGIALFLALYVGVLYVVSIFFRMVGRLIMHPIYRRVMKGRVPLRRLRRRR